jgi:hypothetical protein
MFLVQLVKNNDRRVPLRVSFRLRHAVMDEHRELRPFLAFDANPPMKDNVLLPQYAHAPAVEVFGDESLEGLAALTVLVAQSFSSC